MDDIEKRAREPNPNVAVIHEAMQHFPEGSWMRGALDHAAAELAVLHGRCQRAALTPPEGSDQNLLELAATFETCIAFLPPAGRRNIAKAVDQLRYKGMTTPEGHVVVTRNEAGQAVAVTRQDDEGRILSVIAEFEAPEGDMGFPISVPDGFVLIQYVDAKHLCDGDTNSPGWKLSARRVRACMLAARPEVKP